MTTRFEFGCGALPSRQAPDLRPLAQAAADHGYDRFWVPDQELFPDPFLLLADLAEQVRIDLGMALTNPFSRHPVQIARAMATLIQTDDHRGRDWVVGLGRGNTNLVLGPLGVADGATTARLADGAALVRRLLAGETVAPEETSFLSSPVGLDIDPVSCRVFGGGRGPKALTALVPATDGIIVESAFSAEALTWVRGLLADLDAAAKPHVVWQAVVLLEEGESIPESARHIAAMLIRTTTPSLLGRLGVTEQTRQAAAAKSVDPGKLPDEDVRRFLAVGTPAQIQERIIDGASRGATAWSSLFLPGRFSVSEQLAWFAEAVMTPARTALADGNP